MGSAQGMRSRFRPAWSPGALGNGHPAFARRRLTLGELEIKNGTTDIGLAILSIGTTMSVWSAISPSWFTYKSFASRTEEERSSARTTMFIAGGASLLMCAGFYLVFKRTVPAVAGVLSTVALLGLSWTAVHGQPPAQSTMDQKRQEQLKVATPTVTPAAAAPAAAPTP